eukprot:592879-Amphidinium_carterae.2
MFLVPDALAKGVLDAWRDVADGAIDGASGSAAASMQNVSLVAGSPGGHGAVSAKPSSWPIEFENNGGGTISAKAHTSTTSVEHTSTTTLFGDGDKTMAPSRSTCRHCLAHRSGCATWLLLRCTQFSPGTAINWPMLLVIAWNALFCITSVAFCMVVNIRAISTSVQSAALREVADAVEDLREVIALVAAVIGCLWCFWSTAYDAVAVDCCPYTVAQAMRTFAILTLRLVSSVALGAVWLLDVLFQCIMRPNGQRGGMQRPVIAQRGWVHSSTVYDVLYQGICSYWVVVVADSMATAPPCTF